ncbi:YhcN/YlaJ family sporulation lipoprotein [Virgibacillus sp. YIM 98842]|uniref:YhcN/YlaJ family sporulation lipoprotein n=1 Tax=Virgibacillus sp. YIM 98842 TaxID=2663533 RepID=UPI0013DB10F3|nr:YhcN/YlaJ family sporulation lipoprotein [Virgibacillus sp. YIM 98842]
MKWKFFSVLTVLIIALAGCGTDNNNNEDGAMQDNNNVEPTRFNDTNRGMNDDRDFGMMRNSEREQERDDNARGNDNNNRYEIADEAADKITEQVDEIDRAYVLTTENNAYVAAGLDTERSQRNDRGGQGNTADGNGQDNEVETENLRRNTPDGTDNDRFDDQLSDDVKNEISEIVQSVDNDIENVYVSTNPDFFDLTNNYADDMDRGEPVEGFFDQIGNAIERLFPQNR